MCEHPRADRAERSTDLCGRCSCVAARRRHPPRHMLGDVFAALRRVGTGAPTFPGDFTDLCCTWRFTHQDRADVQIHRSLQATGSDQVVWPVVWSPHNGRGARIPVSKTCEEDGPQWERGGAMLDGETSTATHFSATWSPIHMYLTPCYRKMCRDGRHTAEDVCTETEDEGIGG